MANETDFTNSLPVPEQYATPQMIQSAYLAALRGRGQDYAKPPIRSWTQVAAGIMQSDADRRYLDQLQARTMNQAISGANAPAPLPGTEGSDTKVPTSPGASSGGVSNFTDAIANALGGGLNKAAGAISGSSPASALFGGASAPSSGDSSHPGVPAPSAAGDVSPSDQAFRLSSLGETSKTGAAALSNISADSGGSESYGPLGLNTKYGSLNDFAQTYGKDLGITAPIGTREFKQQWLAAAQNNPSAMWRAHTDYHQNHIMSGLSDDLTKRGVPAELANDPQVRVYMADRKVQMGSVGLDRTIAAAKDAQTPQDFLSKVSANDRSNIRNDFKTYLKSYPERIPGLQNRIDRRFQGAQAINLNQAPAGAAAPSAVAAPGGTNSSLGAPGGLPSSALPYGPRGYPSAPAQTAIMEALAPPQARRPVATAQRRAPQAIPLPQPRPAEAPSSFENRFGGGWNDIGLGMTTSPGYNMKGLHDWINAPDDRVFDQRFGSWVKGPGNTWGPGTGETRAFNPLGALPFSADTNGNPLANIGPGRGAQPVDLAQATPLPPSQATAPPGPQQAPNWLGGAMLQSPSQGATGFPSPPAPTQPGVPQNAPAAPVGVPQPQTTGQAGSAPSAAGTGTSGTQTLPAFIQGTQPIPKGLMGSIRQMWSNPNPAVQAEGWRTYNLWQERLAPKQIERGGLLYTGNDYLGYKNTGIPAKPDVQHLDIDVSGVKVPRLVQPKYDSQGRVVGYSTLPVDAGTPGAPGASGPASVRDSDVGTPEMRKVIEGTKSTAPEFPNTADPNTLLRFGTRYEEYKRSGKEFQDQASRISAEAQAARDDYDQMKLLERVLQHPSLRSGTGSTTLARLNDAARQAGLTEGEMASWRQIAEKLGSRQQVADVRNTTLGQGTAVRQTEADAIANSQFSLDKTPAANLAVTRLQLRALDRLKDQGDLADLYIQRHGRLDNGYNLVSKQWFKDHPFMSVDDLKNYERITAPGSRKEPGEGTEGSVLPSSLPTVNNADDYGRLKSGDRYLDASGNTRTKR